MLAAGVLACSVATAEAAFAPERGSWSGVAKADGHRDTITVRVVERDGRFFLRGLRTTARDTCIPPGGSEGGPIESVSTVRVDRMIIRRDRTFGSMDGDVEVKGRVTSRTRAEGTIWVAPAGNTCAGSTIQFVVRAAPIACGSATMACRP
jgi:hypothetical protein